MRITGKLRPRGLKAGMRTESFYKAIGYKGEHGPDLRDLVGTLELSATCGDDFRFLAALHKAVGGLYSGGKVVIYDDKGKKVLTREYKREKAQ